MPRVVTAAAVLFCICLFCAAPAAAAADTVLVDDLAELTNAINEASGARTIVVTGNIDAENNVFVIGDNKNITLMPGANSGISINRTAANTTPFVGMFTINAGGNLTLAANTTNPSAMLTIDGGMQSGNKQLLVQVNEAGNFTLQTGTLTNNTCVGSHGSGVNVSGGTFTMNSGEISGNTGSNNGGGVYVRSGTFTMNSGEIFGNTAIYGGGGVYVSGGTFTMNSGEIFGNTATISHGGGVYLYGSSTFTMNSGKISGNNAGYTGGGVYLSPASTLDMSGSGTVTADNAVYLNKYPINVTGALTGTGGALNIIGSSTVLIEGYAAVRISSDSLTASEILSRFAIGTPGWRLRADVTANTLNITGMPMVDCHTISPYNTTTANVTFTLNNSYAGAANGAYVNLTNISNPADLISTMVTGPISTGETISNVQLTGLIPGQQYRLNITPLNTTLGGIPDVYTVDEMYTAPAPEIIFENATTGVAITTDPLNIPKDQSVVIRANITNSAGGELKNETIHWDLQGTDITATDGETAYPYNITLTSAAYGAEGNITVTLGSVLKKLNMTCEAAVYLLTVINGTGGGSYPENRLVTIDLTEKTGYTFTGWTSNGGGSFADDTVESTTFTMPANAATVTAGLTPITYTVHYDGNGADGGLTADSTHIYAAAKPLTTNGFTKTNYYFAGWNKTSEAGTVPDYLDNQSVVNLTSTEGDTITLHAVWTRNPVYSVTVTGGTGGGSYDEGATVQISATVPSGKTFDHWTVSGVTLTSPTSATTTFSMPAAPVTATAVFKNAPIPPVPPVPDSGGDGYSSTSSGTVGGTGMVSFGTSVGITGISFAKGTAGTAVLDTKPSGVTAPDNSYALYDITVPAFEGYAQIEFSVPAAILSDQGLTANDVVLQHYVGGKWVKLQTTCLGEVQGAVRYVALTKSFSPFAIVYEKDGAKTIGQATPEPTKQQSSSKTAAGTPVPTATSTQQATATTGTTVPAIAAATAAGGQPTLTQAPAPVVGALLGLLAAGILLRRKD